MLDRVHPRHQTCNSITVFTGGLFSHAQKLVSSCSVAMWFYICLLERSSISPNREGEFTQSAILGGDENGAPPLSRCDPLLALLPLFSHEKLLPLRSYGSTFLLRG